MRSDSNLIGRLVTVYDRYLFAVPVRGVITAVSEKDGAYQVVFFLDNPAARNVTKHSGGYFHYQQCRVDIEGEEKPMEIAEPEGLYKKALKLWGSEAQCNMLAEECSELAAAVHHFHRGKITSLELCDEIADVEIMIDQLKIMYAKLISERKACKLSRLEKRLKKEK